MAFFFGSFLTVLDEELGVMEKKTDFKIYVIAIVFCCSSNMIMNGNMILKGWNTLFF